MMRRSIGAACAVTCVLIAAQSATAQQPATRLTLDDAVSRGLEASHRLAELRARHDAAAAVTDQRTAAEHPFATVDAAYLRTNHVTEFSILTPNAPPRILYPDIPDNYRARIEMQWPIYSGGRTDALIRAADAERLAVGEDLGSAQADLRLEITRAYWAAVTAREAERVVAESLQSLEAQLSDMRSRFDQGLAPPNEVLDIEAQLARQRAFLIDAQTRRGSQVLTLGRLAGFEPTVIVEPADVLAPPAPTSADVEALVGEALLARADRRALERRIESARARIGATEASKRPMVAAVGGYDVARPNPKIFPRSPNTNDTWDIGVSATWSIFDSGRAKAETREAMAQLRAAEERLREFDSLVAVEVRQRRLELESALAKIPATEAGVQSAAESRRVIGERFSAGVAISADVLDAQTALLQAELDRTQSLAGVRLAQARLERAIGR